MQVAVRATLVIPIVLATIAALFVAALGASMTDTGPWYQSLAKPSWTPPDPMFAMIWTAVFGLITVSGITAWRAAPTARVAQRVITLFAVNGALNIVWSLLFFRLQRPDWAMVEVSVLWLSIIGLMIYCGRYSRIASLSLVPYLAWVSVAAVLNWAIVDLNAPFG
ncbi:TspO/MBR family protein [Erythrobacter sp. YT30]|uniref:TspO/MBR family protein n=1 Tax=Erythrobacter sp. YT30 TaxID=1735012 RepID=UPI00076CA0BA|nr:TspO/MBR family protein [Erythrobacter sp. YT30]KWV90903.1 TspO protein [Erythrobacter sp. YT30]